MEFNQLEQFKIDDEEIFYSRKRRIGQGAGGVTYQSETTGWINNGKSKEIAVKWLNPKIDGSIDEQQLKLHVYFNLLMKEKLAKILKLENDYVIRYWAAYLRHPPIHLSELETVIPVIIMDYANGGTLKEYLKGKTLAKGKVYMFTKQLLKGLVFLHENGIIHTDLKPANILIHNSESGKKIMKIGDLDDPILLNETITRTGEVAHLKGTAPYLSPEMASKFLITNQKEVGRKTDIWSLGCVVLDMVRGDEPRTFKKIDAAEPAGIIDADKKNGDQLIRFIGDGGQPIIYPNINPDIRNFISQCHQISPKARPSAKNLLDSQLIQPQLKFAIENLDPQEQSQLLNSTFCKVKDGGDILVVGADYVCGLFYDDYYSEMRNIILKMVRINLKKPLLVSLFGTTNLKSLLEGIEEMVAILRFHDWHDWSSQCLSDIYLPNLVDITFVDSEKICLGKGHWDGCPNLRIISFIRSSIKGMEENFLNELPRLKHFGMLHRPLSASQIQSYQRISSSPEYAWLKNYLDLNSSLIQDKKEGENYMIGRWKSDMKVNKQLEPAKVIELIKKRQENHESNPIFQMKKFTFKNITDALNVTLALTLLELAEFNLSQYTGEKGDVLRIGNFGWVLELSSTTCSRGEAANVLKKFLIDLMALNKDHPFFILIHLEDEVSDEMIDVLSILGDKVVGLRIYGNKHLAADGFLRRVNFFNLLGLRFVDCKNVILQKGCLDGFPKLRAFSVINCRYVLIMDNIFLDLPHFQSITCNQILVKLFSLEPWLKEYLQTNRQLFEAKMDGEVWEFHKNGYHYSSDPIESDKRILSDLTKKW